MTEAQMKFQLISYYIHKNKISLSLEDNVIILYQLSFDNLKVHSTTNKSNQAQGILVYKLSNKIR